MKLLIRSSGFGYEVYDADTGRVLDEVQSIEIVLGRAEFAIAKIAIALPLVDVRDCIRQDNMGASWDQYQADAPKPHQP